MSLSLRLNQVFSDHGLFLSAVEGKEVPVILFSSPYSFKSLKEKVIRYKNDPTQNNLMSFKQWFWVELFWDYYCRISDLEKWKFSFSVKEEELPIPTQYLTKINLFASFSYSLNRFHLEYNNIFDLARITDKSLEQIYEDLAPSFALQRLFVSDVRYASAEEEVKEKINALDLFLSAPPFQTFLDKLCDCALESFD